MSSTIANNTQNALIPYQGYPTQAVEQIMKRVVVVNFNVSYCNNNIILLLWLYDNEEYREELLQDWKVYRLNRVASSNQPTNGTKKSCPVVREVCHKALDDINKADDNCPILLNKLTFNLFSHYLTKHKNKKGEYLSKAGCGQI